MLGENKYDEWSTNDVLHETIDLSNLDNCNNEFYSFCFNNNIFIHILTYEFSMLLYS
jgi:hypothetical protein